EIEIDVDALIGGTVERAQCRCRRATAGALRIVEQHQQRRGIGGTSLREQCAPHIFGGAQHRGGEIAGIVGGRGGAGRGRRRAAAGVEEAHDQPRINAKEIRADQQHQSAQAELHAAAAPAAHIPHILASSQIAPTHRCSPGPRRRADYHASRMSESSRLPVDAVLPELCARLRAGRNAVLVAPPGAGKSTVVPPALLGEPWAAGKRLLLLEPRRLAARAVAARMAASLRERPGETVGYRMRLDTKVGPRTRLEVVTEGILTRMLQEDPTLEGVAAVIFDEFHERSLHADLGLVLCREAQESLDLPLRLLVMSATIDAAAVAVRLGDEPVIAAQGRTFPVDFHYLGRGLPPLPDQRTLSPRDIDRLASQARQVLDATDGDALMFLPGASE